MDKKPIRVNAERAINESEPNVRNRKPSKLSKRYRKVDDALRKIADSRPSNQKAVFQSLEDRGVKLPPVEPFDAAGGWMAGFRKNEGLARSWLSKRWNWLNLTPLTRGPKSFASIK